MDWLKFLRVTPKMFRGYRVYCPSTATSFGRRFYHNSIWEIVINPLPPHSNFLSTGQMFEKDENPCISQFGKVRACVKPVVCAIPRGFFVVSDFGPKDPAGKYRVEWATRNHHSQAVIVRSECWEYVRNLRRGLDNGEKFTIGRKLKRN